MKDAGDIRLLLVEDEPTQRLALHRRLTQAGYRVETAQNGQEALERILANDIQILITDWEMPGMDGVTLCHRARTASLDGYLYILLLTSHSSTADIVAGLDAGADDYLRKPADEAELLARLKAGRRIIDLERSLREAQTQLQRMATTDPLLEVFNRRHLLSELPKQVESARRYERPLTVIMADLDHFKRINDVYGHAEGDAILVRFTEMARSCLRSRDWIARTGGEEFVIVLPETTQEQAMVVAERIRLACESIAIELPAATITVTASFGVAPLPDIPDVSHSVAQLLGLADAALYESKHAGRNRVSAAKPLVSREERSVGGPVT